MIGLDFKDQPAMVPTPTPLEEPSHLSSRVDETSVDFTVGFRGV